MKSSKKKFKVEVSFVARTTVIVEVDSEDYDIDEVMDSAYEKLPSFHSAEWEHEDDELILE